MEVGIVTLMGLGFALGLFIGWIDDRGRLPWRRVKRS